MWATASSSCIQLALRGFLAPGGHFSECHPGLGYPVTKLKVCLHAFKKCPFLPLLNFLCRKKYDSYVVEAIALQTLSVCVKLSVADLVNKSLRGYFCLLSSFYVTDHEVILVYTQADGTTSRPINGNSPLSFPLCSGNMAAKERIWWRPAPLVNFRTDPPQVISTKRQVDLCVRHRGGTDRIPLLLMCCFSLSLSLSFPSPPSIFPRSFLSSW